MLNLYKKLAAFEDVFVVFASLNTFSVECDLLQLEHAIVGDAASKRIAYPHRSHGAVIVFFVVCGLLSLSVSLPLCLLLSLITNTRREQNAFDSERNNTNTLSFDAK